jgi:hypothetical protein
VRACTDESASWAHDGQSPIAHINPLKARSGDKEMSRDVKDPTVLPPNNDMQTELAAEIATAVLGMELVTPSDAASSNPSSKPHVLPQVRERQDL